MSSLKGTAVVAHGGGPTHVINASLVGVLEECARHAEITAVYGACHGIAGVIEEKLLDLGRPCVLDRTGDHFQKELSHSLLAH